MEKQFGESGANASDFGIRRIDAIPAINAVHSANRADVRSNSQRIPSHFLRTSWRTKKEKPSKPSKPSNRRNRAKQMGKWRVTSKKPRKCFENRWKPRKTRFAGCSCSVGMRNRGIWSCRASCCVAARRFARLWSRCSRRCCQWPWPRRWNTRPKERRPMRCA